MSKAKKKYHYDLPQFRDDKNTLLFLVEQVPFEMGSDIYILSDAYDNRHAYRDVFGFHQDFLTYKYIIKRFLEFHELMKGKNPKSLQVQLRTQLIHTCITLGYNNICTGSKPSFENIADIFGQTRKNVINSELKFKNVDLKDENKARNMDELMHFISDPLLRAI